MCFCVSLLSLTTILQSRCFYYLHVTGEYKEAYRGSTNYREYIAGKWQKCMVDTKAFILFLKVICLFCERVCVCEQGRNRESLVGSMLTAQA